MTNPPLESNLPPEVEVALITIAKAEQDLTVVGKWLADLDISDEIIGFHVQQTIEKSLKAVLLRHAIDYPRTHNLRLLIDLCLNNGLEVPAEFLEADVFNRFAVEWRYDLLPSPPEPSFNRQFAYELARNVWTWSKNHLDQTPFQ